MKRIYMDYSATTPVAPEVVDRITYIYSNVYGNPSSIHQTGQDAKLAVDMAREEIAQFISAKPLEICFTSGGTESDNHAILGACFANAGTHIISAKTEHKAVLNTLEYLEEKHGYTITYLPVDTAGNISLSDLKSAIRPETVLVTLMYVNNEIGTIHPVQEIGRICKENGVLFHTDAVQAFGKIAIDMTTLHVDLLSASAHKIYGPKGIGFTYIRKGTLVDKFVIGGVQEFDMRGGTENVAAIAGFGKAVELCKKNIELDHSHIKELQSYFLNLLKKEITDIHINGSETQRIYSNMNVSFAGCDGETLLHHLNAKQIDVSSGSACTSGSIEPSHVIQALNIDPKYVESAIRFGFGRHTTKEEIENVVLCLKQCVDKIRSKP